MVTPIAEVVAGHRQLVRRASTPGRHSSWSPSSPLDHMLVMWHDQLSCAVELDMRFALQRLARLVQDAPGKVISRWSLFAGSGLATHACEALRRFWQHRYDIDIPFASALVAERNPKKRAHLMQHTDPKFVVEAVSELQSDIAKNLKFEDHRQELLPYCFGLDGGPPCTSRSPLNNRSCENIDCVQEGKGATGEGFADTLKCIKKHWPLCVTLECVVQLMQKSVHKEESDCEWFSQQMSDVGYWVVAEAIEADEFGSPVPRERLYWASALHLKGEKPQITHFFRRIFTGFKVAVQLSADLFLTHDPATRRQEARALGIPLHSDVPGIRASRTQKENLSWKVEHKEIYEANSVPWPPDFSSYEGFASDGLLPREAEQALLLHLIFPPRAPECVEYVDINPSGSRVLHPHLSDEWQPKAGHTAWRAKLPTLTGSLKLVIRHTSKGKSTIRLAEAFEVMRLMGWADQYWRGTPTYASGDELLDLVEGLAGNAYSVWNFVPWYIALLATFGRFFESPSHEEEEDDVNATPPDDFLMVDSD